MRSRLGTLLCSLLLSSGWMAGPLGAGALAAPTDDVPGPGDTARAAAAGRDAGPPQPNTAARASAGVAGEGAVGGAAEAAVTYRVFATQYDPGTAGRPGSVEVAVPDKCAKFAALGNTAVLNQFACPSAYTLGLDYRVVVTRDSGQSAAVPVKEVGPWNVDDNYWDGGPGAPRPRRLFTNLPRGTPESQAAYYQGYNLVPNCISLATGQPSGKPGGADAFGRCVLNPAGIDLSLAAAAQLGLGSLQNEWVTVSFLWSSPDPGNPAADPDDVRGPRVGAINFCGGAYVKGGPLSSAFVQQLGCGDARQVTLGSNRIGVINSCGAGYVKEGPLHTGFTGILNCGDAQALATTGDRIAAINGCGGAYVKEGSVGAPFQQQLNCGDARAVSLGGTAAGNRRLGVINGCGAGYVKEGPLGAPFNLQLNCGDARAVVVTADRVGVVNGCGAFYVKDGPLGAPFQLQTGCGDTRAIALDGNRIAVINGCGSLYVKEGAVGSPYSQHTGCGDAQAVALAGDRVGVITGCGAAYVKQGPLSGGFTLQLPCGQARALALANF